LICAFNTIAQEPTSKPDELAGRIDSALNATAIGLIACPIGVVIVVLCLVALQRARENETDTDFVGETQEA